LPHGWGWQLGHPKFSVIRNCKVPRRVSHFCTLYPVLPPPHPSPGHLAELDRTHVTSHD
jgi:hypothetical protein